MRNKILLDILLIKCSLQKPILIGLIRGNIMGKRSRCLRFLDNLAPNTVLNYQKSIKKYETVQGLSIEELILEAIEEQTNNVPYHLLKVIDRIDEFQRVLVEQGLVIGTIKLHLTLIKKVYRNNRVYLPNDFFEEINPKQVKRREYIEFKDVLTKEELKKALAYMRMPAQARALTIIQGGLSNEECEHLTTRAFIDELRKYHQKDDDEEALIWLSDENHPVIWATKLIRWKTKKPYYALIGAEAVNKIAEAKLYELGLPKNQGVIPPKLLNMKKQSFTVTCANVNKKCGFGLVAQESKFRSHNLRRFHATYIGGSALSYEEKSLISNAEIDEMQGRGKTSVQDTYIKSNPIRQKVLYAKVMNNVSLWHQYDYTIIDDDVILTLHDPNIENKKLKEEVRKLSSQLQEKERNSEKLNALKEELGEDTFKELVYGILNAD